MVVDHAGVVELHGPHTQGVVGVGGGEQEVVFLQEGADELLLVGRYPAESRCLGIVVEAVAEFLQHALIDQLPRMPVNALRPLGEVRTPVHAAGAQVSFQLIPNDS